MVKQNEMKTALDEIRNEICLNFLKAVVIKKIKDTDNMKELLDILSNLHKNITKQNED